MPKKTTKQITTAGSYLAFAALDDWFEIGRTGTYTDKHGTKVTFSESDLDSIVSSANPDDPAPLVIGHPKENHPAYGWTSTLKREGQSLFAKADDFVPEFSGWCDKKLYRKRSMSVRPTESGGYELIHIGFLGAKAPAIAGMQDLQYSDDDNNAVTIEFTVEDAVRAQSWSLSSIGRALRNLKNRLIASDGVEEADDAIPEYLIDDLSSAPDVTRAQLKEDPDNLFSSVEDDPVPGKKLELTEDELQARIDLAVSAATTPLQAKINADKAASATRELSARTTKAKVIIDAAIAKGALLPAQAAGAVEFLAALPDGVDDVFEFSVGDGDKAETKKQSLYTFGESLFAGLQPQINLGGRSTEEPGAAGEHEFAAPAGAVIDEDRAKLHSRAMEYSREHKVSYVDAVIAVEHE